MYPSVLDPSKIPQIALESMNETHRAEVELINQLGMLLQRGSNGGTGDAGITEKLQELVEHTRGHFARENQMMKQYGFPAYPVHKGEHEHVLGQIEALQQQWLAHQELEPLAAFIFNDWPRWFDTHVNSMDMVTALFLSRMLT